jgi:hypothetical protein
MTAGTGTAGTSELFNLRRPKLEKGLGYKIDYRLSNEEMERNDSCLNLEKIRHERGYEF